MIKYCPVLPLQRSFSSLQTVFQHNLFAISVTWLQHKNHPTFEVYCAGAIASAGAEGLKPVLQNLYKTNMATFQDVSNQFIVGYQEGLSERPAINLPKDTMNS